MIETLSRTRRSSASISAREWRVNSSGKSFEANPNRLDVCDATARRDWRARLFRALIMRQLLPCTEQHAPSNGLLQKLALSNVTKQTGINGRAGLRARPIEVAGGPSSSSLQPHAQP